MAVNSLRHLTCLNCVEEHVLLIEDESLEIRDLEIANNVAILRYVWSLLIEKNTLGTVDMEEPN